MTFSRTFSRVYTLVLIFVPCVLFVTRWSLFLSKFPLWRFSRTFSSVNCVRQYLWLLSLFQSKFHLWRCFSSTFDIWGSMYHSILHFIFRPAGHSDIFENCTSKDNSSFFSVFFSLNSDSWPSLFVNCFCSSVPGHRILATSVVLFLSSRYVPIIGAPFVEKLFHVLSIHLLWLFIGAQRGATIYLLFEDDKLFGIFSHTFGFGLWWPRYSRFWSVMTMAFFLDSIEA